MNFVWSICLFMILVSLVVNGNNDEKATGDFVKNYVIV